MAKALVRLLVSAVALFAAVLLVPGVSFDGTLPQLAGVALIFGVVNALIRPVLTILSCPLVLLTLGLFTLVINAAMLLLTASLAQRFHLPFTVAGFWPALAGGIVVSVVSVLATLLLDDRPPAR